MFPFRNRDKRPAWFVLTALGLLGIIGLSFQARTQAPPPASIGRVERLAAARRSADAEGRAGDLILHSDGAGSLTIAGNPPLPGHRPLTGAIVDASPLEGDVPDPLIYLRPTFSGGPQDSAELALSPPKEARCDDGRAGVRVVGLLGVSLTERICAGPSGRFELMTTASGGEGAAIADELNVGSLPVVVDAVGALWEEQQGASFVAVAHGGTALLLECAGMHLRRSFSRFGAEVFPSPVLVRYPGDGNATRSLSVLAGDVLTAIARVKTATRSVDVTFGKDRGGTVAVLSEDGREMATGVVAKGATRTLRLPPDFGAALALRDDGGVITDPRIPLNEAVAKRRIEASTSRAGTVALEYVDPSGAPLPVHVLFKGLETPDPRPVALEGRAAAAGRSLYVFDGKARVSLAPGRYRVTASHGTTWSLSVVEVTIDVAGTATVRETLKPVVDTAGWIAADFHLHSAPSPDSIVLLEERVMSLVAEGIDLAVATDHNRVTDLAPQVQALGAGPRLDTAIGVEITSVSQKWGHFNAYPLPASSAEPAEQVPVYHGRRPADMFASARDHGARVVQVNHGRMEPSIGYFDLAHLDPKTGRADPVFADGFDTFEAYNGMWIETRDKIREGATDLVALARRGKRVAAMGNSDSHKLLYQEAGYPRTFVHVPREPRATLIDRVVKTLLAGDTTVSSGPFVELTIDGAGVGAVIAPKAKALKAHVRVSAPAWVPVDVVELWQDDAVVRVFTVEGPPKDGVRFERDVELAVGKSDTVFLAWAEGKTPLPDVVPYENAFSIGFTGLVHVDADGDGAVKVRPRP